MCSRFTAPGNCLCPAEHPRPRAGGAGGARWHRGAWCPEPGWAPGTAALPPWCSWHRGAAPRRVPSTFLSPAARLDPSPLGTAPSHVPLQCCPGWGLQGSRVRGPPGANPLWNAPGWGRGAPARPGAGSVGFQGSCRAGAATGTDGSGLAPLGCGSRGFGHALAVGATVPAGSGVGRILPLGRAGGSVPRGDGWQGGTSPAGLGAPRGLGEVFASVPRCQHGPEAWAQVVVAPRALGRVGSGRGACLGAVLRDVGCAGSGPGGTGPASCGTKYPERLREGWGWPCPAVGRPTQPEPIRGAPGAPRKLQSPPAWVLGALRPWVEGFPAVPPRAARGCPLGWSGRGAEERRRAVFAQPILCPSPKIAESSANTA